ncbi:MAG: hypothetical protein Q4F97_04870 [Bacteroidales bacterium]|nr:hypothetical protein [Bacteroidales bacterium]
MFKDKENQLCVGLTFSFFGLIMLLNNLGLLISLPLRLRMEMLDWRTFLLYGAAFFLLFKQDKTFGLLLLVLGLLLRFKIIYDNISNYSFLVTPGFFIVAGLLLITLHFRKK